MLPLPPILAAPLASTERLECRSQLLRKDFGLLPGGEVTAFFSGAVVSELGVGPLRPAARSLILLSRKHTHGDGNLDAFDVEEAAFVLPVQTRGGDASVRQPIERDV